VHLVAGLVLILTWERGETKNKIGRSKNGHRIEKRILWKKKKKHGNNYDGGQKEKEREMKTKKDIKERKN